MKFECVKDKLIKGIQLAEKIVGRNLSLPVLANVLIIARDKKITLKATNLDIGMEMSIPASIEKDGEVAVNPQILSSLLNNLKKEEKLKINLVNNNLTITTPSSSTLIKSESSEDFPIIPSVKEGDFITISTSDLVLGLRSVYFAAAISDIKPEISSVYIYQDSGYLYFVATDSFRLAEKKIKINSKNFNFSKAIIPFKNVGEIIRAFEDMDDDIVIYADSNQISFYCGDIYLTSRLIDGIYPDYRQIMPKGFSITTRAGKEELIQAFKITNIFLNKLNQVSLSIHPDIGSIEINTQNQDVGENTITVKADITGGELTVKFNARYILDCFSLIPVNNINLNFSDPNNRLFIQGDSDDSFSYLVMPLNR